MQMIAHHVWQMNRFPSNIFNVYLIEDVLIDTATRWDAPSLLKQLANIPLSQVALTHCHPDHQGAVKRICETRGIPLACHEADVAFDPITRDTLFALARAFEQLARLAEAKGPAPERCQHGPTRQGCRPGQ